VARRSVAIRISGQEYRLLSDADEVWLQKVANHVDAAMTQIRDRTGTVDSLDVAILTALNLAKELLALKERLKKTIVFVTHDIFEALALGDRIAVLHAGHLEQIGSREEILRKPATDFVRELFAKPAQQLAAYGGML